MRLFDRFRSNDDEEDDEPEFEEKTLRTELRKVVTNKRATIAIKGEDDRTIEYDVLENGEFKVADEWGFRPRGYARTTLTDDKEPQLEVRIEEWDSVLEVNQDYLKYIDPVWEHEQTLVTEVDIHYTESEGGSVTVDEIEKVDAWVEEGDTTES